MDLKTVNLKENMPSVEEAMVKMELEIEIAKLEGVKAIKFIHGYGSNGVGGLICQRLRYLMPSLKKQRIIKDYIFGEDWAIANPKAFKILTQLKDCYDEDDLNHQNAGMTIVLIGDLK